MVTEVIEREIQAVQGFDHVRSISKAGLSIIYIDLKPTLKPEQFPAIWYELRRKVYTAQGKLPTGASRIDINDDFGDVLGVYYAITMDEGYSYAELRNYATFIKREIYPLDDVGKVDVYGEQKEVINVEISQAKLANTGIHPNQIFSTLNSQNALVRSGDLILGNDQVRVEATGAFESVEEIEELIVQGDNQNQFRLKDVATISRGYLEPAMTKMRFNGLPCVGIAVSTAPGGNTITMGEGVSKRLEELEAQLPVGIEIHKIYAEDEVAIEANNDFIKNLIISILIVVVIILFAMGVRAGILIGSSLLFSILTTLLVMLLWGIELHRTSLAAIIIAMGMLVDNAIVVTDNAQQAMKRGVDRAKALIDGATIPQWGLLGATFIAIFSFLPLYLAPASAAEVIKPLFNVLAVSLLLSWIFALTQTTVYGDFLLKPPKDAGGKDPFDTGFYKKFTGFIIMVVKRKWLTMGVVVALFFVSLLVFTTVKESFFPNLAKPYFKADYWLPQGVPLETTEADVQKIEDWLLEQPEVKNVSVTIGSSPLRFYLSSISWPQNNNLANFLVEVHDVKTTSDVLNRMERHILENYPDAMPIMQFFSVSPNPDAVLEAMFMGPDPEVLRDLTEQAKEMIREEDLAQYPRDSWREKTLYWKPIYSQVKGNRAGVTKENVANTLQMVTEGVAVGEYREGDVAMPILVKDIQRSDYNYNNLGSLQVWTASGSTVPLDHVVEGYEIGFEDPVIRRYDRRRAIAAQCDPIQGIENPELEELLFPKWETIEIPDGYSLRWDGIWEEQTITSEAISSQLPIMVILMIAVLIILFRNYKEPTIILLTVPLIMIGVTMGLKATGLTFGLFPTLGLLGLIGMVIKNAIVLIEQANLEIEDGRTRYEAIVLAARSRAIPVIMAAGTTILGMIPLLPDPLFGGMAATIMGGLLAATILTLIVIPVLYAIFYGLKPEQTDQF